LARQVLFMEGDWRRLLVQDFEKVFYIREVICVQSFRSLFVLDKKLNIATLKPWFLANTKDVATSFYGLYPISLVIIEKKSLIHTTYGLGDMNRKATGS
jgi:hypothetical protein